MTKRELIKRYLDSIGRVRVSGDTAEPLLPFLLGDAIYTIYAKDIAPLPLVREEKKLRNDWANHYTKFNRPFFAAIGEGDEQVTDLMDDFENAIGNELMVLRSGLMLLLGDIPFEKRQQIVSSLLCHVLAQAAQAAWGNVYRVGKILGKDRRTGQKMVVHHAEKNPHLEAISRNAYALANMWHCGISDALVDPNKTKNIPAAIQALCRKIYRWLSET